MALAKYMELDAELHFYMFNGQPMREQSAQDGKGEVECARIVPDEPV